jgi:hypothetical protein
MEKWVVNGIVKEKIFAFVFKEMRILAIWA